MKIFISWSKTKSREMGYILKDILQSFGLDTFVSEKDIIAGEDVQSQINNHIKNCDILVLCFTHENKRSPWLLYEAGLARGLGKTIIPILFDGDPNWDSWIDNPMNFAREINLLSANFDDVFIKAFGLSDNHFVRNALKDFLAEADNIKEKYRQVDVQCEDFVDLLASKESFQVKSPIYKDRVAYFLTGFETTELWDAIIDSFLYTGKYLWIYGRKNMKLVLHHEKLFRYLKEKTDDANMHGIDFRCLFLDPESPEVKYAHKDQDIFFSELTSTIKRVEHLVGSNIRLRQCLRKYSDRREEVIIRLDNCIIYSKPHFDENEYPQIMTNAKFEVYSSKSEKGKESIVKYEKIWNKAVDLFDNNI